MKEIFEWTPPQSPTIAEQEEAYTRYYETWYNNYMVERYIVGKDEKNCFGCFFLDDKGFMPPTCTKLDQPIYQIDVCRSGRMVQLPKDAGEALIMAQKLNTIWAYDKNRK